MIKHDVIIVGGGGAGLRAAIAAHEAGANVAIVSQLHPVRSHTGAAEGGINATFHERDSIKIHAYDTMKGSDYLGDASAIECLCEELPKEVIQLEHWGMAFSRDNDGQIDQRFLAGHSAPRTTYAGAETGHHLLHTLYQQVVKRGIVIYDEYYVLKLVVTDESMVDDRTCYGIIAYDMSSGDLHGFRAQNGVIIATGGLGQVYNQTTNAVANTGDGVAMAYRAGVPLQDMEFIQFHPTTLPSTGVLISEGVRGEGGILYNNTGERFMFEHGYATKTGELASRDVVSRAELLEVQEGRGIENEYVYLDMRHLGEEAIRDRLENIVHLASDFEGVDPIVEPIPVKPGQHFAMGGIETDEYGQTCIEGLYAVGECACPSIHGANRLGGNALPELLVFGKRAGQLAATAEHATATILTGDNARTESGYIDPSASVGSLDAGNAAGVDRDSLVDAKPADVLDHALKTCQTRINCLLESDGVNHVMIRNDLQAAMEAHANVFRSREGLLSALATIHECRRQYRDVGIADPSRIFNTDLIQTIETRNLIDIAEAIAIGALVREESRGAHWRVEYQERNDDEWLKHTMLTWNDGIPEIYYSDVLLEGEFKTYEPRERSY